MKKIGLITILVAAIGGIAILITNRSKSERKGILLHGDRYDKDIIG